MTYGYLRISKRTQDINRQARNILAVDNAAVLYQEAFTGTTINRPQFDKLLKTVKKGDTIIFDSVSRMSRNAVEGYETYISLYEQGINLVFINEPHINTAIFADNIQKNIDKVSGGDTATNNLINTIIEALNEYTKEIAKEQIRIAFEQAEKEVIDLHTRTSQGIMTAKQNGKRIGTQKGDKLITKKSIEAKEQIKKYCIDFGGTLNDVDTMKIVGIARNTYYKYKRELKEQI